MRGASKYISPAADPGLIQRMNEAMSRLRIVDAQILHLSQKKESKKATCIVQYSYYDPRSLTVRKGVEVQHWERRDKKWMLYGHEAGEKKHAKSPFLP